MKRVCLILFGALSVFPACDKPLDENQEEGFNGKSIVVYFSNPLPGVDAVAGASITIKDGQKYGSVQYMAEVIKEETESIFSSSVDTWKNLGNFQFIENVGNCF